MLSKMFLNLLMYNVITHLLKIFEFLQECWNIISVDVDLFKVLFKYYIKHINRWITANHSSFFPIVLRLVMMLRNIIRSDKIQRALNHGIGNSPKIFDPILFHTCNLKWHFLEIVEARLPPKNELYFSRRKRPTFIMGRLGIRTKRGILGQFGGF